MIHFSHLSTHYAAPGDGGDALGGDLLEGHVDPEGELGQQRDLGLHVVALHVRGGVRCCCWVFRW